MAKLSGKEIQKLARSIVTENPGGIRYSVLVEKISQQTPETPKNTIHGAVWNLVSIRVRAQRFSPDMFYVNEFADRLKHHDADVFEELFG